MSSRPPAKRRTAFSAGAPFIPVADIRRLVRFEYRDLLSHRPPAGRHQLIVCRNVLIYFDGDVIERVIGALERALVPDGMLLLGAADRLSGSSRRLARMDRVPRLERMLGPWLITPSIHRVHHSPERRLHDSNYGELITFWDQLFGTFSRSEGRRRVGLDGQVARSDRLLEQIWSPVYGI